MKKNRLQSNNEGFSLVELIVVILIVGIISVGVTASIMTVTNARATQAIDSLKAVLVSARTQAMETGNKTVSVTVKKDADGNVVAVTDVKDGSGNLLSTSTELLGNEGVDMVVYKTYQDASGPVMTAEGKKDSAEQYTVKITGSNSVTLTFNYNSGGLNFSGTDEKGNFYYTDFYIKGAGNRSGTVVILPATGRTYIE